MDSTYELPDGTPVLIRPITPDDKGLLQAGFETLSPESRYRRFFRHLDRLSDAQLAYLTEVDGVNHVAYIAVRADDPGEGLGVARWIRLKDRPDAAEGAVTVRDEYQSLGLGKTLLYVMARDAIAQGIRAFKAFVIGDNAPVLHVLQEIGAEMGTWDRGTMEITIPLPATVEDLDRTTAALVLKAVAAHRLPVEASPDDPAATRVVATGDQPNKP